MSKKKKIQDFDFIYALAKPYSCFIFRQYYCKVCIDGLGNVPKDKHIILAPNHQNALMDALAILMAQPGQPVFLARADIFKKKSVAWILEGLNILPIYRIRDGRDELGKNSEIFEKAVDVLRDHVTLCLMPEGQQSFKRTLLPLVKGMFRIAFSAQEILGGQDTVIVPVGIDYDDYINPVGNLILRFGNPIEVVSYMDEYVENQAAVLNRLRKDVSEGISALIQDIRSEKHYESFYGISLIAQNSICQNNKREKRILSLLKARQKITIALDQEEQNNPNRVDFLCSEYDDYCKKMKEFSLKNFIFDHPGKPAFVFAKSILLLLAFPVFFIGWLTNFIPSFFPRRIASQLKSDNFKSSFHVVLRIIMYSLYYVLIIIILSICLHSFPKAVIIAVISLILSRFSFYYVIWSKNILGRIRFFLKRKKYGNEIMLLKKQRENIISMVKEMIEG